MTAVDPRDLKPGQVVHVTLRATKGHDGDWALRATHIDHDLDIDGGTVWVDGASVVEVKYLPLPTDPGTHILGHLQGSSGVFLLILNPSGDHWDIHGEQVGGSTLGQDVLPGWVRIDPVTMLPMDPGGLRTVTPETPEPPPEPAATVAEVRPCEGCDNSITGCLTPCKPLPTGIGAVIRFIWDGVSGVAVKTADGDDAAWRTKYDSGTEGWAPGRGQGFRVTEVLSYGVEVPS